MWNCIMVLYRKGNLPTSWLIVLGSEFLLLNIDASWRKVVPTHKIYHFVFWRTSSGARTRVVRCLQIGFKLHLRLGLIKIFLLVFRQQANITILCWIASFFLVKVLAVLSIWLLVALNCKKQSELNSLDTCLLNRWTVIPFAYICGG